MTGALSLCLGEGVQQLQLASQHVMHKHGSQSNAAWRRMWLEFGVHVGGTITHTGNWKLKNCPKDAGLVHGFDTFTGLPEDWGHGYQKVSLLTMPARCSFCFGACAPN